MRVASAAAGPHARAPRGARRARSVPARGAGAAARAVWGSIGLAWGRRGRALGDAARRGAGAAGRRPAGPARARARGFKRGHGAAAAPVRLWDEATERGRPAPRRRAHVPRRAAGACAQGTRARPRRPRPEGSALQSSEVASAAVGHPALPPVSSNAESHCAWAAPCSRCRARAAPRAACPVAVRHAARPRVGVCSKPRKSGGRGGGGGGGGRRAAKSQWCVRGRARCPRGPAGGGARGRVPRRAENKGREEGARARRARVSACLGPRGRRHARARAEGGGATDVGAGAGGAGGGASLKHNRCGIPGCSRAEGGGAWREKGVARCGGRGAVSGLRPAARAGPRRWGGAGRKHPFRGPCTRVGGARAGLLNRTAGRWARVRPAGPFKIIAVLPQKARCRASCVAGGPARAAACVRAFAGRRRRPRRGRGRERARARARGARVPAVFRWAGRLKLCFCSPLAARSQVQKWRPRAPQRRRRRGRGGGTVPCLQAAGAGASAGKGAGAGAGAAAFPGLRRAGARGRGGRGRGFRRRGAGPAWFWGSRY